jgi:hypothetical protein
MVVAATLARTDALARKRCNRGRMTPFRYRSWSIRERREQASHRRQAIATPRVSFGHTPRYQRPRARDPVAFRRELRRWQQGKARHVHVRPCGRPLGLVPSAIPRRSSPVTWTSSVSSVSSSSWRRPRSPPPASVPLWTKRPWVRWPGRAWTEPAEQEGFRCADRTAWTALATQMGRTWTAVAGRTARGPRGPARWRPAFEPAPVRRR